MSGESISLQFGELSSHIGSQLWNIQHNLLNCAEENDFLDVDQIFMERSNNSDHPTYIPRTIFFNTK